MNNWLTEYAQQLTTLNADNLPRLEHSLADDVEFKDPFNQTYTKSAFINILQDMFTRLEQVSFTVHGQMQATQGSEGVLYWTFSANSRLTGEFEFEGASRVQCDAQGKIQLHHDYWDASALMQTLPVFGLVIKKLRNRMSHS